ncbi:His Kinase A (phospho-acceptor) domain-containing protein [Tranquillimonas rosea]|uniref:histidine kinase n=1 Tax=Tranquillimonas rosea TaxID=641238 RepID=A0A1H9RR83_9RHOB|nr:His Kinase A (phospho-acceptor) domain-containing protein [Tranquillimonas rosea]
MLVGLKSRLVSPTTQRRVLMGVLFTMAALVLALVGLRIEQLSYSAYLQDLKLSTTVDLIDVREGVEARIFEDMLILNEVATYIGENPDLGQQEFSRLAGRLVAPGDSILNIAAAPDLEVAMTYPVAPNAAVLGLNYRTHDGGSAPVTEAIRSGDVVLTAPVTLVQGGTGLIAHRPVYTDGPDGRELWGVVSLVIDFYAFLRGAGLIEVADTLDVLVVDDRGGELIFGDPEVAHTDHITLEFDFPDGSWTFMATTLGGWPATHPDFGRERAAMISVGLLFLGGLAYTMYLADARRMAQLRLSDAIEALDDGFAMFGPDGRLVMANASYKKIYSEVADITVPGAEFEVLAREELRRGQHSVPPEQREQWVQERVASFLAADTEHVQLHGSGRHIRVSDRRTSDGSTVGLRVDVTELDRAKESAEAANAAKTQFISLLSHELRTPLTVVLGHVRLVRHVDRMEAGRKLFEAIADPDTPRDRIAARAHDVVDTIAASMDRVEQSGDHLLYLINEMLNFAKIESGTLSVEPTPCDIYRIVGPVEEQMRLAAEEKGLSFSVDLHPGCVLADEVRARQILFNLIGNAVKFTETGGIALRVEMLAESVRFTVRDSGPGIPDAERCKIFDAFHQVDSSAARRVGGTGLGLAISLELARAQGGDLSVESVANEGSAFILTLPRAADSAV